MRLLAFFKREAVLTVAALCALATMVLVPPDAAYLLHRPAGAMPAAVPDGGGGGTARVRCFCSAGPAVAGGGAADAPGQPCPSAAAFLCVHGGDQRCGAHHLCSICGSGAGADRTDGIPGPLVVLQTMAANLGSMATPVGNPQNLYLYADYELTAEQFFGTMLPLTLVSLAALTAASLLCVRDEGIQVRFRGTGGASEAGPCWG